MPTQDHRPGDTPNEALESAHETVDLPNGKYSSLTPEEQEQLARVQKRNLVFALLFGIILAILGFFAGQHIFGSDEALGMWTMVQEVTSVWPS